MLCCSDSEGYLLCCRYWLLSWATATLVPAVDSSSLRVWLAAIQSLQRFRSFNFRAICWLTSMSCRLLQTTMTPYSAYAFHVCLADCAHHHQIRLFRTFGAKSFMQLHATVHADVSMQCVRTLIEACYCMYARTSFA